MKLLTSLLSLIILFFLSANATGVESCVPPPSGLISWVSLDVDGSALDGPDGQVFGATSVSGYVDGAMNFDDAAEYVGMGNDPIFGQAFAAFSMDAWVRPTQGQENGTIVSKTELDGWAMRIKDGQLGAELRLTTGNINMAWGSVPLNEWSFVAVTYDGSIIRAYIDGVEVGSAVATGTVRNAMNASTHVFIGNEPRDDQVHTGITEFNFIGDIDEVEIFDRAITPAEIAGIYNAGTAGKCKGECPNAGIFPIEEDFNNGVLTDPNWVLQGSAQLNTDWLRLTDDLPGQAGNATLNNAFSSSDYVLIDFEYATVDYNAANCSFGIGDGLAFFLIDGDASPSLGVSGAALGYSHGQSGTPSAGIDGGFIAIGLDEFGNFAGGNAGPSTCGQLGTDAVTIRGEETADNFTAYRCISTSLLPGNADIDVPSRNDARRVRIILSPGGILNLFMDLNDGNGLTPIFQDLNTGQIAPPTFKLGFSSSTGGACIAHEIDNLLVGKPADIDVSISGVDTISVCEGIIQYTITVANNGPNDAEAITLESLITGQVDGVSWNCADCVETAGSGIDIDTELDIQIGDTVIMTVTVDVSEGDTEVEIAAGLDFGCTGLISSNVNGSSADASTYVTDNSISIELGMDTVVCDGVLLLDASTPGGSYEWQDGSSSATFTANASGTYFVEVAVGICMETDSIEVDIMQSPDVEILGDNSFCETESTTLTAQLSNSSDAIQWSDGSTTTDLVVDAEGFYSVTTTNVCGSATDTITVTTIICDCIYSIPNAFSPNSDGLNDEFMIANSASVDMVHIEIYDRWGEKVFESDALNFKWDGKFRGRTLGTDVFYYYAEIGCSSIGPVISEKGNITLIR